MTTPSKQEILEQLTAILDELFEVPPADVKLESEFYEDLDIDSIDAVDMMVRLNEILGRRIEPEAFKQIRTVAQCVDAVDALYRADA